MMPVAQDGLLIHAVSVWAYERCTAFRWYTRLSEVRLATSQGKRRRFDSCIPHLGESVVGPRAGVGPERVIVTLEYPYEVRFLAPDFEYIWRLGPPIGKHGCGVGVINPRFGFNSRCSNFM